MSKRVRVVAPGRIHIDVSTLTEREISLLQKLLYSEGVSLVERNPQQSRLICVCEPKHYLIFVRFTEGYIRACDDLARDNRRL